MQKVSRSGGGGCGRWGLAALALAVLVTGVVALNSGPTAIKLAVVARDFKDGPVGVATIFNPQDNPLHCVVQLERASKGVGVKFVWTAVEAGGQQNYILNQREVVLNSGQDTIDAYLSLPYPWPPGTYRIDLAVDGRPAGALNFTVAEVS